MSRSHWTTLPVQISSDFCLDHQCNSTIEVRLTIGQKRFWRSKSRSRGKEWWRQRAWWNWNVRIVLQRGRWWRREIWTRDGMWRRLDGGTFCFGFALRLPRQSPERPRHRPTMTETRPLSNKAHNHEDHKLIIVNVTQWMHLVEELNDDDFWWKWGCKIGLNPYLFFSNKSVYASTR